MLSFVNSYISLILSCILIGIGSAVFPPESSRIANMASGGRIGVAQSIFQIGGNLGTATAPLLVALIVLPDSQELIILFTIPLLIGFLVLKKIANWHKKYLANIQSEITIPTTVSVDFPKRKTKLIFGILLVIIFSKFIYAASLSNYYSFYLIEKFNLTIKQSQFHLFVFIYAGNNYWCSTWR